MNSRLVGPKTALVTAGLLILFLGGCVHKIHVAPTPPMLSQTPIPQSVRVSISSLELEGADHMPGITLFKWPKEDLRDATIDYIQQRHTFASVSNEQGTLVMAIRARLSMRSRGEYRYLLRMESDVGPTGKPPIKSYRVEKEAVGSRVRWVTASDQDPIAEAVQATLDDLLLQIEEDHGLYGKSSK